MLAAIASLAAGAGCGQQPVQLPPAPAAASNGPQRVEAHHLPNVYRVHPHVLSGGLPAGEAAFAELRALGVRTIISVDGARPDVETARRFGLRYVHLPHGYGGIAADHALLLAKAVRELPGPIYIHCHHGRHRSPAAAAVACVGAGLIASEQAVDVLRAAGTSPHYRGLYEAAAAARVVDAALLAAVPAEFPEQADIPPLAEAMVEAETHYDRLRTMQGRDWRPPPDHPDLSAPHEALLLREQFAEMLRLGDVQRYGDDFRQLLHDSLQAAGELEAALRDRADPDQAPTASQRAAEALRRVGTACEQCHRAHRDLPLSQR
jgi:protein tyrosine phosphatase (PTP) superfamily phosphohydrolase (DUF442 family)